MKIGVIVPCFPTISETFIVNHITGLIDKGYTVAVIALTENKATQKHRNVEKYDLLDKTIFVKKNPSNKIMCRAYALWLAFTHLLKYPLRTIKILRFLVFIDRSEFYQKLFFAFALMPLRCELYHFHFGNVGRLGAFVKKAGIPIKMITSFHGYDVNQLPQLKPKNYYEDLFQYGDRFIANTEFTKKQVLNLGCNSTNISVIPVGLNVKDFPFKPRILSEGETIQILTVGRLVEKKGHVYSIRAVAQLIKEGFNICYTIAGDGPLRNQLEKLVVDLGIESCVTFSGEVTQEEVICLYNQSHLFVLSSVTAKSGDKEGQALVNQEAQACGLPVVSTLHNGIPDGILDGQSGFLVPEKDVTALVWAVKKLLDNPSLWPEMGRKGRQLIESKYENTIIISHLHSLYSSIKKNASFV